MNQAIQDAFCRQLVAAGKTAFAYDRWVSPTRANNWQAHVTWDVWRPDRCPHTRTRSYQTLAAAWDAAARINRKLYPNLVPA